MAYDCIYKMKKSSNIPIRVCYSPETIDMNDQNHNAVHGMHDTIYMFFNGSELFFVRKLN